MHKLFSFCRNYKINSHILNALEQGGGRYFLLSSDPFSPLLKSVSLVQICYACLEHVNVAMNSCKEISERENMLSKLVGLTAQQSAVFHLWYCVLVYEFRSKFP